MADGGPYLLGLDAGNTVIKAVLFDSRGQQLAVHGIDGATHKPAAGMVERSLPELWRGAAIMTGAIPSGQG
jgi:L-xylulokinase